MEEKHLISSGWIELNKRLDGIESDDNLEFLNNPIFRDIFTFPFTANTEVTNRRIEDLLEYFDNLKQPISVLEVGAGWGNFCRLLCNKIKVSDYFIVDTISMSRFSKKLLSHYNIKEVKFVEPNDIEILFDKHFDLFVANSCLSETPDNYRRKICELAFSNCDNLHIIENDSEIEENMRSKFNIVDKKQLKYTDSCGQSLYLAKKH